MSTEERIYHECRSPRLRAGALAHAIRLGKLPHVGTNFGFSATVKQFASEDEIADLAKVDTEAGKVLARKTWFSFVVTQIDIDAAKDLINRQDIQYREPKTSIMRGKPK